MKLEEMRNRVKEINNRLEELSSVEDFTDEQVQEVNSLNDEFTSLKGKIEAKEKLENMKSQSAATQRKTTPIEPQNNAGGGTSHVTVNQSTDKYGGFKSCGDFLMAVKKSSGGNLDERFKNQAQEQAGEEGGFLVPEEMRQDIQKKVASDESLLNRTRQFPIGGNTLTLPTDETHPWTGGVEAYWTAEGAQITDSKHKFGEASWKLKKIAALVKTTDELLDDAVALESYIRAMAPVAIMHKINEAILTGNGVGKPTGLLNSGFKIAVPAEGGQSADTLVARNVLKMYSRMIPTSRANAAWFINPEVEEQLRTMVNDNGDFIYAAPGSQFNASPYGMLLGRPVIPLLGGIPALGDEGDIIFADLNYYYSILKSAGVQESISTHLLFDRDQTAYKFIMRIDGHCPFKKPVQVQNGSYELSGFVTVADR